MLFPSSRLSFYQFKQYFVTLNSTHIAQCSSLVSKSFLKIGCTSNLFIFPIFVFAQNDLESRFFTISSESLPVVESLSADASFSLDSAPSLFNTPLRTFKMNVQNYRESVDMMTAIANKERFVTRDMNVAALNSKYTGLGGNEQYQSDGSTTVYNRVYKESRGLDLFSPYNLNSYNSNYICESCLPYRARPRIYIRSY